MEQLIYKRTVDAETSVARPALAPATIRHADPRANREDCALMVWRGNANSDALTALSLWADSGFKDDVKTVISQPGDASTPEASPFAPAMTYFRGSTFIAWIGVNPGRSLNVARIYQTQDTRDPLGGGVPARWVIDGDSKVVLPHTSVAAPALTASSDAVFLAWTGADPDHRINLMRSNDAKHWYAGNAPQNHPQTLPQATSNDNPALGFNNGTLCLAWTSKVGALSATALDKDTLGMNRPRPAVSDERSGYGPAAAAWREHCVIAWTGNDMGNMGHLNTTEYDGANFLAPSKRTFEDTSLTGPSLTVVPQHPHQPARLCIGWTGIDGAGKLNIGVADEFVSP
jgi:hypothetical protein